MIEDDKFTEFAKWHLKMRLICGFIAGIVLTLLGIGLIIYCICINDQIILAAAIFMLLCGLFCAPIFGYFVFRKPKRFDFENNDQIE